MLSVRAAISEYSQTPGEVSELNTGAFEDIKVIKKFLSKVSKRERCPKIHLGVREI